jgi:hypothetical protein
MPSTNLPAPPSPPTPVPAPKYPLCQTCGKEMRIISAEPYPRYTNIDLHNYGCDCGHNEDFFVAHKN